MRLFKYSKFGDYFFKNLRENQIWFSAPSEFNDIDDSALRIDWRLTDEDIENEFIFNSKLIYERPEEMIGDHGMFMITLSQRFVSMYANRGPDGAPDISWLRESVTRALEVRRQTIGISCFSQDNLNRLLWSHYADGDRGVCIEIETDFDSECFPQLEVVNYVDALPQIKLLVHMKENIIALYTTKAREWSYEREIRAFQHLRGNHQMDPRCLVNCFFGERASPQDIEQVKDVVRDKYGKQVGLLKMVRNGDGQRYFQPLSS